MINSVLEQIRINVTKLNLICNEFITFMSFIPGKIPELSFQIIIIQCCNEFNFNNKFIGLIKYISIIIRNCTACVERNEKHCPTFYKDYTKQSYNQNFYIKVFKIN